MGYGGASGSGAIRNCLEVVVLGWDRRGGVVVVVGLDS